MAHWADKIASLGACAAAVAWVRGFEPIRGAAETFSRLMNGGVQGPTGPEVVEACAEFREDAERVLDEASRSDVRADMLMSYIEAAYYKGFVAGAKSRRKRG